MTGRWSVLLVVATLGLVATPRVSHAHDGHSKPAAWHACDRLALGASCAFTPSELAIHRGTCRAVADGLLCVRNRPIERGTTTGAQVVARASSPAGGESSATTVIAVALAAAAAIGLGMVARRGVDWTGS